MLDDKKELKHWNCDACGGSVMVEADYEPVVCCGGYMCGCMGLNTEPVFCDECWENINS